ncbi:MAG TPA: type II secretion system F family protein [Pyrinomonadaceae bacterium]|nr:type II secretion system F family protein [Pyrinomonadaceae bacterium]
MLTLIVLSTFVSIALIVMAIYWMLFRPVSATAQRLHDLDDPRNVGLAQSIEANTMESLAARLAEPINRLVPPSAADAKKLHKELMQAGYRSPSAPAVYRVAQLGLMLGFPAVILVAWSMTAQPLTDALMYSLFALGVGFLVPRFILNRLIASRKLRITWGLADALDLMVITMEAGLGLNAAMLRVCEELQSVHPDISKEFELANLEIRVGRERSEALRNLADRTGVEDLNSLVGMLIQADRFGTSIARAVRVYADSLRTKRRQRAEQAAQKAAFKLLLPLGALLFPTMFIIILGPALLNISDMLGGGLGF